MSIKMLLQSRMADSTKEKQDFSLAFVGTDKCKRVKPLAKELVINDRNLSKYSKDRNTKFCRNYVGWSDKKEAK